MIDLIFILGLVILLTGIGFGFIESPITELITIIGVMLMIIAVRASSSKDKYKIEIKEEKEIIIYEHCTNIDIDNHVISFEYNNEKYCISSDYIKITEEKNNDN